jgi:hypothetical protein
MEEQANVSLSVFELELVTNPDWILTKNRVIQKVYELFGLLSEVYKQYDPLLNEPVQLSPKIAKGENYKGLPYVMLDYPRYFGKEDVFAIRTFFWWGNFFSITLHLKGRYKTEFETKIISALLKGELNDAWINTSEEEWMHDINNAHVKPVVQSKAAELLHRNLVKLTFTIPLQEWNEAKQFLEKKFKLFVKITAA